MAETTKIKDLTPQSKQVNVLAKVVSVGETKEIPGRFGSNRKVAEAVIGDDTGIITLSLWQDQIGTVAKDDVLLIDNGFVSLVPRAKGNMRLNVGKYGKMEKKTENIEVNNSVNMSEKEYEGEPRERRFNRPRREFGNRDREERKIFGGDREGRERREKTFGRRRF